MHRSVCLLVVRSGATPIWRSSHTYRGEHRRGSGARPRLQPQNPAPRMKRLSMLDVLDDNHSSSAALAESSSSTMPTAVASPYIQQSSFSKQFNTHTNASAHLHESSSTSFSSSQASAPASTAMSSMEELRYQQGVLRESFDHSSRHHNVRLLKDKKLYESECASFRAAHGGRWPTRREVNPYADVTLAPVAALKALAHLDPRTPTYDTIQDALLLQQSVTRNQLLASSEKVLMRCKRCFHVYGARPREIFGKQKGADAEQQRQSWIAYEMEKEKVNKATRIAKRPHIRKTRYSVGRQREEAQDNPMCCPQCRSPNAQWAMEYIHQRTHARR